MAILSEDELREFSRAVVPCLAHKGLNAFKDNTRTPEEVLDDLLSTADEVRLSATHKAAAFGTLAGFLNDGSGSQDVVRDLCTRSKTFQRAFRIYLRKSEGGSAKPIRQLLKTLSKILKIQDEQHSEENLNEAVQLCLTYILGHEDPSGVKPAILVLEMFLAQGCLSPEHLLKQMGETADSLSPMFSRDAPESGNEDSQRAHTFISHIIQWASLIHIAPSAGLLLVRFCKLVQTTEEALNPSICSADLWMQPVRDLVAEDESMLEVLERHILPELFRLNPARTIDSLCRSAGFTKIWSANTQEMSISDIRFCLLGLKYIGPTKTYANPDLEKTRELLVLGSGPRYQALASRDQVVRKIAKHLLTHNSSKIRTTALDLIASAYTLPDHTPGDVLDSVIESLAGFHAEADPQARNEFLSTMKRLLTRIEISVSRLSKDIEEEKQSNPNLFPIESNDLETLHSFDHEVFRSKACDLKTYWDFVHAYISILRRGLRPSSPYQRQISCLKVIESLVPSTGTIRWDEMLCLPLTNTLLALVLNAFDDVRTAAANILQRMLASIDTCDEKNPLRDKVYSGVIRSRGAMRRAKRADLADGFGRLNGLWFGVCPDPSALVTSLLVELECDLQKAATDLACAVATAPIHGHLIALRYIISRKDLSHAFDSRQINRSWAEFHARLMSFFAKIWKVVRPVLCVDSPEGQDFGETGPSADVGIKDTLSYSWRTLKETSSLMQAMVSNLAYAKCLPLGSLQYGDYKMLGELSFVQLAELRHRGAFSTVSQTFTACCIASSSAQDEDVRGLVDGWYREALKCIEAKANALTRRSAGIPSIVTGLLIARSSEHFFGQAFDDLQKIAMLPVDTMKDNGDKRLPQVHAINCLKDVCTSTRLGPPTEEHLADMIKLAAYSLGSRVWAIRNSGTMLLKALIGRLTNGSSTKAVRVSDKHRPYAKATHEKLPELSNLIFDLLEKTSKLINSPIDKDDWKLQYEVGFPALQIISHVGVVPRDRDKVKTLLTKHLESRIWNIRAQAARALSVLVDDVELFDELGSVLLQPVPSTNLVHGYLECVQEHLNIRPFAAEHTLIQLFSLAERLLTPFACLFVLKLYLQIICQAVRLCYEVQQAVPRIGMERTGELSIHEAQSLFQGSLRQFTGENLPQDVFEALTCTNALLELCHLPVDRTKKKTAYPLFNHLSTLGDIPDLLSIRQALCNSPEADIDQSLTSSLELLEASWEGRAEDCNQARDHVTVSLSSRAGMSSNMSQVLISPETVLDHLKCIKPQLDRILLDKYSVEDSTRRSQLEFCGAALSWMYQLDRLDPKLHSEYMPRYFMWLRLALQENSDEPDRFAAVCSMWQLRAVLPTDPPDPCWEFTRLERFLPLLSALDDDSEDIRRVAARIAIPTLQHMEARERPGASCLKHITEAPKSRCFEPVMAKQCLIRRLSLSAESTGRFLTLCICSITGTPLPIRWDSEKLRLPVPSTTLLQQTLDGDEGVLFEEERANLYIDEVRNAELWMGALVDAVTYRYVDREAISDLEHWLLPGLGALGEYLEGPQAQTLPASSVREVFVVGMRFLVLAEGLVAANRELQIEELSRLVVELEKLEILGKRAEMDDHWAEKIDSILDAYRG